MLTLDTSIREISGVGTVTARALNGLDIETVEDLLFYFPFRYDDFSHSLRIDQVEAGTNASIVGQVELIQNKKSPRRRLNITEALVSDDSGSIKVIWFNQPFIIKNLKEGDRISLAGKVEEDYGGVFMPSPVYEKISTASDETGRAAVHTQGLVPHYHLSSKITQKQLRFAIRRVLSLAANIKDWLPEQTRQELNLPKLAQAIKEIHFPTDQAALDSAKTRLSFNELFLIQLQSQLSKADLDASSAPRLEFKEQATRSLVDSLPFKLTDAQRQAAWEILQDMDKDRPMTRLLEGDVGSGKTVVAALVMLNAALNGRQAVLMAPTEILAKQHYATICKLLDKFEITIGLVTRSDKRVTHNVERVTDDKKINSQFVIQNSQIIIGTHALIQDKIEFKNLALAVVDEQHRFGVAQRKALLEKSGLDGAMPHLLSMTATPIPRSLALALYGDLSISVLNQMPVGRKKIITKIVEEGKRPAAYEFIRKQIAEGRQVFVVCPLIDISDKLGVKSVKEEFEKLDKLVFPELSIGLLHGKLRTEEKERVMQEFLDNQIKILVSTSVVEVGVDVPNATIMMIEGADRFGLAQLHQFRGRVGRGEHQSYCFLFAESGAMPTQTRLKALEQHHDGFALAKIDLELRGPGEVYGTMQKGFPELKIATLFDYDLMKTAKDAAEKLLSESPDLENEPLLKKKTKEWESRIHLE